MAVSPGVCAVEDRQQQGAVSGGGAEPVLALLQRLGQRHEERVVAAVEVGMPTDEQRLGGVGVTEFEEQRRGCDGVSEGLGYLPRVLAGGVACILGQDIAPSPAYASASRRRRACS